MEKPIIRRNQVEEDDMLKSMTGFGRAETVTNDRRISVEMKSVNHRYLDLNIRMPKKLAFLESDIRNLMKKYLSRGKVDVFITYEDYSAGSGTLKYNPSLAGEYLKYLRQMKEEFGLEDDLRGSVLARFPEVFMMEEQELDEEAIWSMLEPPLKEACDKLKQDREREGAQLQKDLMDKLAALDHKVTLVEQRTPEVVDGYRKKIEEKVHELLEDSQIDESRIASEVVLFADKIANDEETVRLHSHIHGMMDLIYSKDGIGRKLDFMAQEMNREANTILSKSTDIIVSDLGIELKTEIEKIREQIQNIE